MLNQSVAFNDSHEREKLRILEKLNVQIQSMAFKLDQIVTQVEENVFKVKTSPLPPIINTTQLIKLESPNSKLNNAASAANVTLVNTNTNNINNINTINNSNNNIINTNTNITTANNNNNNTIGHNLVTNVSSIATTSLNAVALAIPTANATNTLANTVTIFPTVINTNKNLELASNHQLVKIIDQPIDEKSMCVGELVGEEESAVAKSSSTGTGIGGANKPKRSANKCASSLSSSSSMSPSLHGVIKKENSSSKQPDTSAKRNKQQRQFNTFVRESINQLLGADFMKTHDVQDIDQQVMEMIRKEAVENYLPDNIRPRRAWHLAKASLRTLKRTLNNKKT